MKQQETNKSNTESNVLRPNLVAEKIELVSDQPFYSFRIIDMNIHQIICESKVTSKPNAELVCKAVNNYQSLIDALKDMLSIVENERLQNGISLYKFYKTAYKNAKNAIANTQK